MTYPYSNKRINPLTGASSGRVITEELTVAELGNLPDVYGVQLRDGIIQGTLSVYENVTGGAEFTIVSTEPLTGQVGVKFTSGYSPEGLLIFNVADDATNVVVTYKGYGSVTSIENQQGIQSTLTTKGDLQTYSTSVTRLGVGSDGKFLQADSSQSEGLAWSDFAVKDSGGNTLFTVDPASGQLQNVYSTTTGTGYPSTLHNGWLCRAFVNFNGTGTVAIRSSGNVSSITDNGTGDYTINFATNLPDADYAPFICSSAAIGGNHAVSLEINTYSGTTEQAPTVSGFRCQILDAALNPLDVKYVSAGVLR